MADAPPPPAWTSASAWHRFLALAYAQGDRKDIDNPDQRIAEDIITFIRRLIHFPPILAGRVSDAVRGGHRGGEGAAMPTSSAADR